MIGSRFKLSDYMFLQSSINNVIKLAMKLLLINLQVASHAINSYTNCNRPLLAVKCAMVTLEAVRSVGAYIDAGKGRVQVIPTV